MVLVSKCKLSLCVVDTEIKSCYTRFGGNLVLQVTVSWKMGQIVVRPTSAVVFPLQGHFIPVEFTLLHLISFCLSSFSKGQ
ncbi:hypothetical protein AV530_017139 [Patagioenas fasciata monilis]|uniref:Uncharacterized protein n=1 Tax=Patagioenas fasciata monilis TaxID=372326 RepID=A0A1V4JFC3_PATFA|nr:hypothetical protein AV530_017139 [Patagioenas fasciata monilis]